MDTMSWRQFTDLHGIELFDQLVKPLLDRWDNYSDHFTTAVVQQHVIDAVFGSHCLAKHSEGEEGRLSFILLKQNFIGKYGVKKWEKYLECRQKAMNDKLAHLKAVKSAS